MGQVWLIHSQLQKFEDSMNRCLANPFFLQKFYASFLDSSDEVRAKFEHTDFEEQRAMLKNSLRLVLRAAQGLEDGREHLATIAERHSKRHLGIGAHLYALWLDALVEAAAEADSKWEPDLEQTWRAALEPCIERMQREA